MTYWQEIGGIDFLIHCTRDSNYVTKMMSLHGILDKIQDHSTGRQVGRLWKLFKYSKPISCHNRAKHLVDDHNNWRHAPIGLDQTWCTKWWPTRQFTFLIGIAKVQAWAHKELPEPQLNFHWTFTDKMRNNKLDNSKNVNEQVTMPTLQKRGKGDGHVLIT